MKVEICTNSVHSAVAAQEGGAHRIELCCNLKEGGLTPSAGTIQLARKWLAIEIFVLIRPRVGDFCYSDIEMETMLKEIFFCKEQGMDGVVLGVLQKDHTIDRERTALLIEAAKPLQVTFHRAFDLLPDPFIGLEQLVELGVDRILTSGQATSAIKGQTLIKDLVERAQNRITILAGGGLSPQNMFSFVQYTGVPEVHLSAKQTIKKGEGSLFAASYFETNMEAVKSVIDVVTKKK